MGGWPDSEGGAGVEKGDLTEIFTDREKGGKQRVQGRGITSRLNQRNLKDGKKTFLELIPPLGGFEPAPRGGKGEFLHGKKGKTSIWKLNLRLMCRTQKIHDLVCCGKKESEICTIGGKDWISGGDKM